MAFPLPSTSPGGYEVALREPDDFRPDWSVVQAELGTDGVSLHDGAGRLRVQVHDNPWCACGSEWRYDLLTLNVACGEVTDPRLFLGTPTKSVNEQAFLR